MRAARRLPEVEKTSLFGTAVHAVLRSAARAARRHRRAAARGRRRASTQHRRRRAVARRRVPRRRSIAPQEGRDWAQGRSHDRRQGARGLPEGAAPDLARSPHAHDHRLRAGVLPAALRLRARTSTSGTSRSASRTATARRRAGRSSRRSSTPAISIASPTCIRRRRSIGCSTSTPRAPRSSFPKASGATSERPPAAGADRHQRRQREHRDDRHELRRATSSAAPARRCRPAPLVTARRLGRAAHLA